MRIEILCLLHFCRPGFRTLHISPWSSKDLQVLRICRSKRLDMGLKRVSWVRRYQGQCRALRPLGHQGCRLRNHKKDQPLCSGYSYSISDCTWEPVTAFILDDVTSTRFLLITANLRICVTFCSQPKIRPASVLGGETTPSCFIAPVKTVHLWS